MLSVAMFFLTFNPSLYSVLYLYSMDIDSPAFRLFMLSVAMFFLTFNPSLHSAIYLYCMDIILSYIPSIHNLITPL
jgi:hypothetical protein